MYRHPSDELERIALDNDKIRAQFDNKPIRNVIVVPEKLANIVI